MDVSILVPIYNVERFIESCAVSLFEQTYSDIEYIFVDDCSPDGSVDVLLKTIERYPMRKPNVRIIHNEKNLGLGSTRNVGLRNATGDYIMFVDSDDVLPLDSVEKLYNAIKESGTGIVEGAFEKYYKGKYSAPIVPYKVRDKETYIRLILSHDKVIHSVWGKIYKKTLFADNNIWFAPSVTDNEDFCTNARLAYITSRSCIDDVVYCYRIGDGSFFSSGGRERVVKNLLSTCKAIEIVEEYYRKKDKANYFNTSLEMGHLRVQRMLKRENLDKDHRFCKTLSFKYNNLLLSSLSKFYVLSKNSFFLDLFYLSIKRLYVMYIIFRSRLSYYLSRSWLIRSYK